MTADDPLGPAHTQYSDWVGTVAMEPGFPEGLEPLLRVDAQRYLLIGFKAYSESNTHLVTAYAVDRALFGEDGTGGSLMAARSGRLPVIEFVDIPLGVDELVRSFDRFAMVFHGHPSSRRYPLHITETVSLNRDDLEANEI